MSANTGDVVGELRPFYPTSGSTSFQGNQNNVIEFVVPRSIEFFRPSEAYLTFDLEVPAVAGTVAADAITSGTPPVSLNVLAGAHAIIRQVDVSVGNVSVCSVQHYGILARRIAGRTSSDDAPVASLIDGRGSLEPAHITLGAATVAQTSYRLHERMTKAARPAQLLYIQTYTSAAGPPVTGTITAITPRKARFCLFFQAGFMAAARPFANSGEVRIRVTLEGNARTMYDFPAVGTAAAFRWATATTLVSGTGAAPVTAGASEIAELFPPGSVVHVAGVASFDAVITSITQNSTGTVTLNIPAPAAMFGAQDSAVTAAYSTAMYQAVAAPTIDNVILYVNRWIPPTDEARATVMATPYSWMGSDEALLNILSGQASPSLNYNALPIRRAIRAILMLEDVSNAVRPYPGNSLCLIDGTAQTSATSYTGLDNWQAKIGDSTVPLQPLQLSKWVPGHVTELLRSYYEAGQEVLENSKVHSIETLQLSRSYANMAANLSVYFNRFLALSFVDPTFMTTPRDISRDLIQFTFGGTASHAMSAHLYVDHVRTLVRGPFGEPAVAM